ncbi:hypothetical protein [Nocardia heshunensis]
MLVVDVSPIQCSERPKFGEIQTVVVDQPDRIALPDHDVAVLEVTMSHAKSEKGAHNLGELMSNSVQGASVTGVIIDPEPKRPPIDPRHPDGGIGLPEHNDAIPLIAHIDQEIVMPVLAYKRTDCLIAQGHLLGSLVTG